MVGIENFSVLIQVQFEVLSLAQLWQPTVGVCLAKLPRRLFFIFFFNHKVKCSSCIKGQKVCFLRFSTQKAG